MVMLIQLDQAQKLELSTILEKSDWLKDAEHASRLVKLLPEDVHSQWTAAGSPKMMALSIVDLSDEYRATDKLVAALEQLAGGSTAAVKAREFFDDLLLSANFNRATRTELVDILTAASPTQGQLRALLRQSAPYSFNEDLSDVAAVVRHLALLPARAEGFPQPLIEFAMRASRKVTPTKVADKLAQWAREASRTKNLASDLAALEARIKKDEAEASPTVMLLLEPHPDDPEKLSAAMWLWGVEDAPAMRPLSEAALSVENLQKAVSDELGAIGEELEGLEFRFEVFVPRSMADHDFDSWNVHLGLVEAPRRLGEFFPTALRSLERLKMRALRKRWRDKWGQFRAAANAGSVPAFVVCDAKCNEFDFRRNLDDAEALMIGFCFVPGQATASLMDHLLEAGVPVGVWLRRCMDRPDLAKDLHTLLSDSPHELPRRLYARRKEERDENGFWHSVTVLWDDPDRIPETRKLSAPR